MILSQNIQISADFSNSNNVNLHNKKLEIASLNLDDYNSKLDNHVCKLLYNVGTCEFETLVKNDYSKSLRVFVKFKMSSRLAEESKFQE